MATLHSKRPTSVLSNASSLGKKSSASTVFTLRGKSPAAQSRIPLGPRQGPKQHFVTNSRRRRRANELILNTLEARRRALAPLSWQQANNSLYGSLSYLADGQLLDEGLLADDYGQRLSLSPSPLERPARGQHQQQSHSGRSPAPTPPPRPAMSDLGGGRLSNSAAAAHLQRQRLLRDAAKSANQRRSPVNKRPPLAMPDQNSSDLCSSNSNGSSDSDSSSGSQFTQLVTSELVAPDCGLLDARALELARRRVQQLHPRLPVERGATSPPRAPERVHRKAVQPQVKVEQRTKQVVEEKKSVEEPARLRRGVLRRDSIRRHRLQPPTAPSKEGVSSSDAAPSLSDSSNQSNERPLVRQPQYASKASVEQEERQQVAAKQLSKSRRLDIENNPFLHRHHFRSSTPMRSMSNERRQQLAESGEQTNKRSSWNSEAPAPANRQQANSRDSSAIKSIPQSSSSETMHQIGQQHNATSARGQPREWGNKRERQYYASEHQQVAQRDLRSAEPEPSRLSSASKAQQMSARRPKSPEWSSRAPQGSKMELVSEGARSSDDLNFDADGNQRQTLMGELWRHERTPEEPGRLVNQERTVRERYEFMSSTTSISPPLEFADPQTSRRPSPSPKPEPAARPAGIKNRSLSEERPAVAARRFRVQQVNEASSRPPVAARPATSQAHLPKLERTADDEFKKRVDYLRKLARSNLSGEEREPAATKLGQSQNQRSSLRGTSQPRPAGTKPMSTNWSGARSKEAPASLFDERAQWNLGRYAANEETSVAPPASRTSKVASTNLDTVLLKTPANPEPASPASTGGAWRRSNSTLASLTGRPSSPANWTGSRQVATQVARPQSPLTISSLPGLRLPATSAPESQQAVKLVVRERAAPKLDYAFVEQRPPVETTSSQPRPSVAVEQKKEAPSRLQPREVLARRAMSPRSPEFGTIAASSNDDSAIASSVSSPSLSFMTQHQSQQPAATSQPSRAISPATRQPPAVEQRAQTSEGALQSILRRHQQQQQQLAEEQDRVAAALAASRLVPLSQQTSVRQYTSEESSSRLVRTQELEPSEQRAWSSYPASSPSSPVQARPESPVQSERQESSTAAAPKRVHFNDRTSVRSFESISSLASNSTAVPNEPLRQMVGSPDSMGSGSTSRLSAESPDMRRGPSTSGAAIYAIRGDPELQESGEPVGSLSSQQIHNQHLLQQQQQQRQQVLFPSHSQQFSPMGGQPFGRQFGSTGLIRMTAPPSINTPSPISPPQQQRTQVQYIARPTSLTSTRIVPAPVKMPEEDDDPDYAARLRAANRAFAFGVPPVPAHANPQMGAPSTLRQAHLPPETHHKPSIVHNQRSPTSTTTITTTTTSSHQMHHQQQLHHIRQMPNQQQQQQQQQRPPVQRRLDPRLLNFQTEV